MTNKAKPGIAAIVVAACIFPAVSFGQGLLDQQLGDKPAAGKQGDAAKPDPAKADGPPPAHTAGNDNDISRPDAVKKIDDQELIKQLTQPPGEKPNPQQAGERMKTMLDRMDQSKTRLANKDPGELTQETQRRIVTDLDVLIEIARQQQSGSGSGQGNQQTQPGQQRQSTGPEGPKNGEGGTVAANTESLPRGASADAATGDMRNHDPANWGNLPPRDRDQVSHGANEEYLPTYREMIDRYYQALAEMGKSKSH